MIPLILAPFIFAYYKRKQIAFYFSGNQEQKQAKAEKKLLDQFVNNKITKEVLVEYITSSSSLLQASPTSPRASHGMAKGFYYNILLSGFKFNIESILNFVIDDGPESDFFTNNYPLFAGMYRNAIRADSFADEYPEQNSNRLLLLLYETLEKRKNSALILEALARIDYARVTPDVRQVYIWLNFISATNSGNLGELEKIYQLNESTLSEGGMKIDEREYIFLKGIAAYKSKDFIESLKLLRECKKDYDFITIEATKTEAMVFFHQNLHQKAIDLLETLYVELQGTDQSIKEKLNQIVSSKSGLKSKIL